MMSTLTVSGSDQGTTTRWLYTGISPDRTLWQMNTHPVLMRTPCPAQHQPYNGDSWDIDRWANFTWPWGEKIEHLPWNPYRGRQKTDIGYVDHSLQYDVIIFKYALTRVTHVTYYNWSLSVIVWCVSCVFPLQFYMLNFFLKTTRPIVTIFDVKHCYNKKNLDLI